MFSPTLLEGGPAKGTRSSRRRQRPASTDASVQPPKAKRQRLPLSETTFVNPDAAPETFEVKSDKIDLLGIKRDGIENAAAPRKELSVRAKKPKAGERASKGDGSVVLTTNNAFTVSKLPALPDRLRNDAQNQQHGAVYSSSGFALTLTHTHAFVWPYASTAASPETFTFALPYPSKHVNDPLPLGSLVAPSASSDEPGLVIVMPMSGKVAYWESISSAATLDFIRQQRTGVEDTISGMFSGEHVIQIVNAESAGFVLVFSSGRLAYMSVRDAHGRPGISVQFLRNGLSTAGGGFFGSIRNVLSSSALRGDIAAARASYGSVVGERVVVAATAKGRLQSWKVHRGGHHSLVTDADIRDKLIEAVPKADPATCNLPHESLEIVDFTFVPRGLEQKYVSASRLSDALTKTNDGLQHVLLLVSFSQKHLSRYSLVEARISANGVELGMVRPINSYTTPVRAGAPAKPRIYLPRPALVAFVVFDRAVVLASITSPPISPDAQLQDGAYTIPDTFEDVVDFKDDDTLEVAGSGLEEPSGNGTSQDELRTHRHKTKNPTVVLLVRGVGTVRVAITEVDRFASDRPPEVTAKSKLEQAVFFGVKGDNPLVFQGRDLEFSSKLLGDAAIELSHEIVSSKTPFIANLPASLENNLKTRVAYLDSLIAYLNAMHIRLDIRTRWVLLFNAEKLAVATWIWKKHEEFMAERPKGDKNLISETAVYINEQQKTELNPAIGEVDPVRHWFINDVWRLEIFIAWAYQIIKWHWTQRITDEAGINRLLWEAVTVNNGALFQAHQYRLAKSETYGVDPRKIPGGASVPEPWTSTHFITNNLKRLVEFCFEWLDMYAVPSSGGGNPPVDMRLVRSVREMLPSLINRYLLALVDYASWAEQSNEPEKIERAKTYQQTYEEDVNAKILKLKDYELWEEAIELAKEHKAFDALAEVVVQQVMFLEQQGPAAEAPTAKVQSGLSTAELKKQRMGQLMEEYKEDFAFRAYQVLLESSGVQTVLEFPYDTQGYATAFLRTKPELAKISWINDVEREKDIDHAATTLLDLGLSREQHVWNKKIELSLSKLALLAEEGEQSVSGENASNAGSEAKNGANFEKIDRELELIRIQDSLISLILPSIREAVDESAELELALKEHAILIPKKQKALLQIFEDALGRLLKHEALHPLMLIDLLTLAYLDPNGSDAIGDQFCLALKVARYGLKSQDRVDAERLIWRRCLIRDDWKRVNETNNKGDLDQLEMVGNTAAYHAMFAIVDEQHSDESFRPFVRPSDALGVFVESLDRRWDTADESFRGKLLEAMKAEDTKLRTYVEKAQLDAWYRTTRDCAEKTVADAYSRRTSVGAQANGNGSANAGGLFGI